MNVLLIGSGGREHALAWKIASSPVLNRLFCAPGNPGMESLGTVGDFDVEDHGAVVEFCRRNHVDFVVIGPEAPLVAGLADALSDAGICVFGPSASAARLEGSKGFTKDLCSRYDIPTARYQRFNNAPKAKKHILDVGVPIVIKADGLAAGKGVVVATEMSQALAAVDDCFEGAFGDAGAEVVVEEFLEGEEASFFCICDGKTALPLTTAQDHKQVGDGDTGPNTGGMGAYSPAPVMTAELVSRTMETIIIPTMRGMAESGAPFTGVLYAGLMITEEGPKLIEYNTRFGDPECQVLMMRMKDDALLLMKAAADGLLASMSVQWHDMAALCVVMAAKGYPGTPVRGGGIRIPAFGPEEGLQVFHAGTRLAEGRLVANGGRVLGVTALGGSVAEAQRRAYAAVDRIEWQDGFCRRDIGWRAVEREAGKAQ